VVVDDEHAPRRRPSIRARRRLRPLRRNCCRGWQPQRQLAALAEALARGFERAAVQRGETARQREPDAETAAADVRAVLGHLREHLEDFLEPILRYTQARVAHAYGCLAVVGLRPYFDVAAGRRVFRGVAEQIADDLRETLEIAADVYGLRGRVHVERVLALVDERPRELDGGRDDGIQVDRRPLELDRRARDARQVEEVVDEMDEVLE